MCKQEYFASEQVQQLNYLYPQIYSPNYYFFVMIFLPSSEDGFSGSQSVKLKQNSKDIFSITFALFVLMLASFWGVHSRSVPCSCFNKFSMLGIQWKKYFFDNRKINSKEIRRENFVFLFRWKFLCFRHCRKYLAVITLSLLAPNGQTSELLLSIMRVKWEKK